jgi:hypothetical protein
LALVAVLLGPISASAADETTDYDAVKAETLRLAGVTPPAGAEGEDTKVSSETAPAWWPWKGGEAEKPPEPKTYKVPTMADDGLDYHAKPAPIVQAVILNLYKPTHDRFIVRFLLHRGCPEERLGYCH